MVTRSGQSPGVIPSKLIHASTVPLHLCKCRVSWCVVGPKQGSIDLKQLWTDVQPHGQQSFPFRVWLVTYRWFEVVNLQAKLLCHTLLHLPETLDFSHEGISLRHLGRAWLSSLDSQAKTTREQPSPPKWASPDHVEPELALGHLFSLTVA